MKIKSKLKEIDNYKTEIKDLQNKINTTKQDMDKLYDKLKEINPENNSVIKFQGEYITDEDIKAAGQKVLYEQKQRKEETIENAKHWFKITCPHCKTSFECCENGYGTHCYDYLTKDGKEIVGSLETQTLECPICNKYFKDTTLKHEEDC
jgi:septal ring factor EnvC (AmiA/AmiB activator)